MLFFIEDLLFGFHSFGIRNRARTKCRPLEPLLGVETAECRDGKRAGKAKGDFRRSGHTSYSAAGALGSECRARPEPGHPEPIENKQKTRTRTEASDGDEFNVKTRQCRGN